MPIIQFDGPNMTKEEKAQLAMKLTAAATEVFPAIPAEAYVLVIRENSRDNFAVGGKLVSDRAK